MKKITLLLICNVLLLLVACSGNSEYSPKPKGYFRILYPEKAYRSFPETAPFSFDYPAYAQLQKDNERNAGEFWYNLAFPQFNGRLHLTYYTISSIKDYEMMVEDARKLAFKHTVKASAIDQKLINYPNHKVHGVYYEIDGNTASSVQFFLTDSTRNYFRGALYFNERPQYDSIAPIIAFIKKDIDKLISTFKWTNTGVSPVKKHHVIPKPVNLDALKNNKVAKTIPIADELPGTVSKTPAGVEAASQFVKNASYNPQAYNTDQDSLKSIASKFFNLFISGKISDAYAYFADEFTRKVNELQIAGVQKEWLNSFGTFEKIEKITYIKQATNDLILLNTKFSKAKPVFAISFNEGRIIGFFKNADNFLATYRDPEYVGKDTYEEKDIVVETGSFKLPGTLTIPYQKSNFPIVVLVHGSGPNDRDETLGNTKTFRDLALGLAAKGIATIRYDKRTRVYGAKSIAPGQQLTVKEEVIDDAVSAIKLAATLPGVNKNKVFLLGHSLGAMMAPRIAQMTPELAGVITLGNPARKFADLLAEQLPYLFSLQPQSEQNTKMLAGLMAEVAQIRNADTVTNKTLTIMGANMYYWVDINSYDQVALAKKLKKPLLILQAEKDYNVSMNDYAIWKEALKGKKNVTFMLYPELNHGFIVAQGAKGTPADYERVVNVPEYVINDITTFIQKN